jgi:multiple antibiotic resistance protein
MDVSRRCTIRRRANGPGTISTAINFAGQKPAFAWTWVVIGCFALICVATYLAFVSGERIVAFAKPGLIKVVTRLMGLIITVMSVQMVITGIDKAIEMYR